MRLKHIMSFVIFFTFFHSLGSTFYKENLDYRQTKEHSKKWGNSVFSPAPDKQLADKQHMCQFVGPERMSEDKMSHNYQMPPKNNKKILNKG